MATCRSLKEFLASGKIKKEPDHSSTFLDESRDVLYFPTNYYKEEIDLNWEESDNYCVGNYESCGKMLMENSKIRAVVKNECVWQKEDSQPKDMNIQSGCPDYTDETNKNLNLQNYHYKEELDLSWDEKDNDYDQNNENFTEKPRQNNKSNEVKKNNSTSILQSNKCSRLKKKNMKVDNPDSEKDCPKCKKRLKNLNTLKKHLFYCGRVPHLQCDSCTYKAKYKNALISHIMRHHPQQIQNSRKQKTTQTVSSKTNKILKAHQLSDKFFRFCVKCNISTDKATVNNCGKCKSWLLYQCKKCKETFPSREKCIRHIINICDPKGYYHCPACDFKGTLKRYVKSHLKVHLSKGSHVDTELIKWRKKERKDEAADLHLFKCPSCEKQYQRNASLASHMRFCIKSQGISKPPTPYVYVRKNSGLEDKVYKYCANCNNEVLTYNIKTSECCESMVLFKCLKCYQCYDKIGSINHHVRSICYKTKCDMCDYEGSQRNLALHVRRKHDLNKVECPKCKTKLKNRSCLQHHSYFCGKEPLNCHFCSYTSKIKYELKIHILKNHMK